MLDSRSQRRSTQRLKPRLSPLHGSEPIAFPRRTRSSKPIGRSSLEDHHRIRKRYSGSVYAEVQYLPGQRINNSS